MTDLTALLPSVDDDPLLGYFVPGVLRCASIRSHFGERGNHHSDCSRWSGFHEHRYLDPKKPCTCTYQQVMDQWPECRGHHDCRVYHEYCDRLKQARRAAAAPAP